MAEWFTLTLRENLPPEHVLDILAAQMPHGLTPIRIEPMGLLERPKQAEREKFLVRFTGSASDIARWRDRWTELLTHESFVVERKSKNGPKPTDVRALLAEVSMEGPDAVRLTFDWSREYMSPVNLVHAVNAPISALDAHLTKVGQEFPAG
jgi:hypothetical protein